MHSTSFHPETQTVEMIEQPYDEYETSLVEQIEQIEDQYIAAMEQAVAPLLEALQKSRASKPVRMVVKAK